MHQRLQFARNESVVDEKVFLNSEFAIAQFKIAGMVILHTMPQDQVLCSRRRTDRIRLHEFHPMQRAFERSG